MNGHRLCAHSNGHGHSVLYISDAPQQCLCVCGKKKKRSMRAVLMLVVAALVCIWGNIHIARANMSPTECKVETKLAGNACLAVLYGKSPSADCCQRVRVTHVECVCPYISPKVASIIRAYGLNKLIKKIEGCGRAVPHNLKCGSKFSMAFFIF